MNEKNKSNTISFLQDFIAEIDNWSNEKIKSKKIKEELNKVLDELQDYKNNEFDFKEIVNHLYDGIYISDGSGKTLYVNKAYSRITGIKAEEVVGRNVKEIQEEGKFFRNAVTMEVIKHKKQVNSVGVSLINGKKMLVTGNPIFDENGNVKKVVINNREMTDLIEIKGKLDASQRKLKIVKEHERKTRQEIELLRKLQFKKDNIIGESEEIKSVIKMINQVADVDATVLITGETGVGKEVVANEIYSNSKRENDPFIKVNCAAIPNNLLESELFGYERGAFTGAKSTGKAGMFELANNGTLLLDEIGEMPLELQSKLLRVIQQKEITRIGGIKPIELDVRIIAATNKDLKEQVKLGRFRQDLFYRLNVIPIYIPPLRLRLEDIEPLTMCFIDTFNKQYKKTVYIEKSGIEILKHYSWPGNIRELQNIIERMVVITDDNAELNEEQLASILNMDLLYCISEQLKKETGLKEIVENIERRTIEKVLAECGSTRKAARVLKVDQSTIVKKAKKLGIKLK